MGNKQSSRMSLSCSGYHSCVRENDIYTCDVGDSNYLFEKCDRFKITLNSETTTTFDELIKSINNLHFEYEHNGKEVIGDNLPIEFVVDSSSIDIMGISITGPTASYFCDIPRPKEIAINRKNPKASKTNIKLVFRSQYIFDAQFSVNASHENN